jgi:hypothetical protein
MEQNHEKAKIHRAREKENAFLAAYLKHRNEEDRKELNTVYRMVRYYLPLDGSVKNYVENYANPYTRWNRIMFLEADHTKHDAATQEHIDQVLSTYVGE